MQEITGEYPWEQHLGDVSKAGKDRGKGCQIVAAEASAALKGDSGAG